MAEENLKIENVAIYGLPIQFATDPNGQDGKALRAAMQEVDTIASKFSAEARSISENNDLSAHGKANKLATLATTATQYLSLASRTIADLEAKAEKMVKDLASSTNIDKDENIGDVMREIEVRRHLYESSFTNGEFDPLKLKANTGDLLDRAVESGDRVTLNAFLRQPIGAGPQFASAAEKAKARTAWALKHSPDQGAHFGRLTQDVARAKMRFKSIDHHVRHTGGISVDPLVALAQGL